MAGETFRVVVGNVPDNILMRIVTGDAADAGIGPVEASAVGQSVRLEAYVGLALPVGAHYRFPTAVALTTEV